MKSTVVGKETPKISFFDTDSRIGRTLQSLLGKEFVAIEFFSVKTNDKESSSGLFDELAEKYISGTFISCGIGRQEDVASYFKSKKFEKFKNYSHLVNISNNSFEILGVKEIPHCVLLSRDGKILHSGHRFRTSQLDGIMNDSYKKK